MTSDGGDTPGRTRCGAYWLLRPLAQGGFGQVWVAEHGELGRPAAVKILKIQDLDTLERFRREAEAVCLIDHPGLARVYDIGQHGAESFIAMELVEGRTLAQILEESGTLPAAAVIELARQLLEALKACHLQGVIHRDLKPANVMRDQHGRWRILDLGMVRWQGRDRLTHGVIVGTPRYMAPEMVTGDDVDGRADIYQVGLIAYECLTGVPVVSGKFPTLSSMLTHVVSAPPPEMPLMDGPAAAGLRAFLQGSLQKERERRFESAAHALESLMQGELGSFQDCRLGPAVVASITTPPGHNKRARIQSGSPRGRGTALQGVRVLAAMGLVALLGVIALGTWSRPTPEKAPSTRPVDVASPPTRSPPSPMPGEISGLVRRFLAVSQPLIDGDLCAVIAQDYDRFLAVRGSAQRAAIAGAWKRRWDGILDGTGLHPVLLELVRRRSELSRADVCDKSLWARLVLRRLEVIDVVELLREAFAIDPVVALELSTLNDLGPRPGLPPGMVPVARWTFGDRRPDDAAVPGAPCAIQVSGPVVFTRKSMDAVFVSEGSRRKFVALDLPVMSSVPRRSAIQFRANGGSAGRKLLLRVSPTAGSGKIYCAGAIRVGKKQGAVAGWVPIDPRLLDGPDQKLEIVAHGAGLRAIDPGIRLDEVTLYVDPETILVRASPRPAQSSSAGK